MTKIGEMVLMLWLASCAIHFQCWAFKWLDI